MIAWYWVLIAIIWTLGVGCSALLTSFMNGSIYKATIWSYMACMFWPVLLILGAIAGFLEYCWEKLK